MFKKLDKIEYGLLASLICAFAVCVLLSLAGCQSTSSSAVTVTVQTDIQTALNVICPVEAQVQAAIAAGTLAKPNANVQASLNTLAAVCPPNLAPTNIVTATVDLINAYAAIAPLLAKIK